jgi:hypothetical protein
MSLQEAPVLQTHVDISSVSKTNASVHETKQKKVVLHKSVFAGSLNETRHGHKL